MTTSVWDKSEIDRDFTKCSTLQEMIAALEAEFSKKGEVICEIRINGDRVEEEDEKTFSSFRREQLDSLIVYTSQPNALIQQALQSCLEFIPHVQSSCVFTAENFRSASMAEAHAKFAETIEGCFWLVDTLKHIRAATPGAEFELTALSSWSAAETQFSATVKDVVQAYEKKDFILVADLLEYELSEAVTSWAPILHSQRI